MNTHSKKRALHICLFRGVRSTCQRFQTFASKFNLSFSWRNRSKNKHPDLHVSFQDYGAYGTQVDRSDVCQDAATGGLFLNYEPDKPIKTSNIILEHAKLHKTAPTIQYAVHNSISHIPSIVSPRLDFPRETHMLSPYEASFAGRDIENMTITTPTDEDYRLSSKSGQIHTETLHALEGLGVDHAVPRKPALARLLPKAVDASEDTTSSASTILHAPVEPHNHKKQTNEDELAEIIYIKPLTYQPPVRPPPLRRISRKFCLPTIRSVSPLLIHFDEYRPGSQSSTAKSTKLRNKSVVEDDMSVDTLQLMLDPAQFKRTTNGFRERSVYLPYRPPEDISSNFAISKRSDPSNTYKDSTVGRILGPSGHKEQHLDPDFEEPLARLDESFSELYSKIEGKQAEDIKKLYEKIHGSLQTSLSPWSRINSPQKH